MYLVTVNGQKMALKWYKMHPGAAFRKMGLTTEEGYLVLQSYEYRYDVGGRYNVIDVYDVCGNLIYQVSLK